MFLSEKKNDDKKPHFGFTYVYYNAPRTPGAAPGLPEPYVYNYSPSAPGPLVLPRDSLNLMFTITAPQPLTPGPAPGLPEPYVYYYSPLNP